MEPQNTTPAKPTAQDLASQIQGSAYADEQLKAKARQLRARLLELADQEREIWRQLEAIRGGTAGKLRNLAISAVVFTGLFIFGRHKFKRY
jgi:hypothetical protein